ncbi:GAF and ANTAR domain-containing protein [Actinoallomurus vinaceus]|uniref:GAF and ANTAR domain-containing protein n=1 Tax=Actinoallomurus vinaceus TaxID=1080074 RepID=UPI0031E6F962
MGYGPHISSELAVEIARLGLIHEASETAALRRVTELTVRTVWGCAGATGIRWTAGDDPEPLDQAGTHPDLSYLSEIQCTRRDGPIFDVARSEAPVFCGDTLVETRWPGFTAIALQRGVRCFATTVHRTGPILMTLTMYGVVPGALDRRELGLGALLAAQGGAAVSNTRHYEDAHREAVQLRQAVEARAVVDQAKGVLMHAMGCDADTAFNELKRISQNRHVKLTALARRIVEGSGPGGGGPGRSGLAGAVDGR